MSSRVFDTDLLVQDSVAIVKGIDLAEAGAFFVDKRCQLVVHS